jgi:D-alanyl-D-alanine carboxypeptidase (penicillin-binding protein 5/6)
VRRAVNLKRILAVVLLAIIAFEIFAFTRPLPTLMPAGQVLPGITAKQISLPWPATGQAALGAVGFGLLSTNQTAQPVPMASVAKIITALAILKQKPLALNQQGPTITFDATDLSYYSAYVAQGGSVAKVTNGETISEYQALQTMILPSANNVAESLARWAFGSPEAYYNYANQFVKTLGMNQTTVSDASGFAPTTISTAKDLVFLGEAAMANPTLAQIVGQMEATVPVVGVVKSTNWLLGTDGFIGIKTGNTDQAGGCYLFATDQAVGTQTITVVGAILGAPTLSLAITNGKTVANAAKLDFADTSMVKAGQVVGSYKLPWGGSVQAIAQKDLSIVNWGGTKITPVVSLIPLKVPVKASAQVGTITVAFGQKTTTVPAITKQPIANPPLSWRLLRF